MKEIWEFIKKLWSNKRTRALAILVIYAVFFTFVFILISNGTTKPNVPVEDPSEDVFGEIKDTTNYRLEIIGEETFEYDVLTNLITYNDQEYELEEQPSLVSKYSLEIYTPINIYNLLQVSVLESTNHLDNSNTYLVKISDFERIIYNNNSDVDEYIKITVYNNNEKIKIDLSNHYNYVVNMELRG